MTIKDRILKGLEACTESGDCCSQDCPYRNESSCMEELHTDALKQINWYSRRLKLQEPAKPIQQEDSLCHCPGCMTVIMKDQRFCHACGQPIEW